MVTLFHQTHNMALASTVADFIVSLGIDGSVCAQEADAKGLVDNNPNLANEALFNSGARDIGTEEIPLPDPDTKLDGKLISKEEIAEGHVTWKSLKLFLSGLGGNQPLMFFFLWMTSILITDTMNTFQVWFLGYWGSQYKERDPSTVDVPLYVPYVIFFEHI